jgi:hypothetical protein
LKKTGEEVSTNNNDGSAGPLEGYHRDQ